MGFVYTSKLAVDSISRNIWYSPTGSPFRVKNISSGTDTVNTSVAYPILPGETVENIPGPLSSDREYTGFNTVGGISELRILDTNV